MGARETTRGDTDAISNRNFLVKVEAGSPISMSPANIIGELASTRNLNSLICRDLSVFFEAELGDEI